MNAEAPSVRVEPGSQPAPRPPPPHGRRTIKQYRILVKKAVTSMTWEMSMFVIVIIYMVIVFFTFALADQKVREVDQCGAARFAVHGAPAFPNPFQVQVLRMQRVSPRLFVCLCTQNDARATTLHVQQIARLICGLDRQEKNNGWITLSCKTNTIAKNDLYFTIVDFAFLVFFLIEIGIKFFGIGEPRL